MNKVHQRLIAENGVRDIGYELDFDFQKPIMEFQPVACTKNPPYIDFYMPVKVLE